jgi:hypothetical protein
MKNTLKSITTSTIAILVSVSIVHAIGTLTPIGTAGDDTQYTLNDIYHKLTTGADAVEGQGQFITPGGVPNASFRTLTEIYDVIPEWRTISNLTTLFDAGYYEAGDLSIIDTDLIENNIRDGITIFGIEGTVVDADDIPAQTISPNSTNIPYGVYDATTLDAVDTDLIAENIKQGVTIFGIEGELEEGEKGLPKTGQTISYVTNDDGDLENGLALSYTDNGDGTVTDNATGLIWQKDGAYIASSWSNAISYCANNTPGLPGTDWRLPNIKELYSILDYGKVNPAINAVFTNTANNWYWSSTTWFTATTSAWSLNFAAGNSSAGFGKTAATVYVRCVK